MSCRQHVGVARALQADSQTIAKILEGVCYLATDLRPGVAEPEGTEQLQVRWVPLAEALAMTADGRITDAMSVVCLQRVALMRRQGSH
jgi:hypothetical protein